jgi:hypothetical protein
VALAAFDLLHTNFQVFVVYTVLKRFLIFEIASFKYLLFLRLIR